MCQLFYAEFNFKVDMEALIDIARPILSEDGSNEDGFGLYIEYGKENRPYLWKTEKDGASVAIPEHVRERIRSAKRIMAHTRSKTRGEVSSWNSQPFMFKGIVGAHNGTIATLSDPNSRYSDSRILYKNISDMLRSSDKKHVLKTLRRVFKKHNGTAALIFRVGDKTYFFRDTQRTLYKIDFQSSEGPGIVLATNRLTAHVLADIVRNLLHARVGYTVELIDSNKLFMIGEDLSVSNVGGLSIQKAYQYQYSQHGHVSTYSSGGISGYTRPSATLSLEDNVLIEKSYATYIISPNSLHDNILRHIVSIAISTSIKKSADTVRIKMPIPISFKEGERDFFKKISSQDFYSLGTFGFKSIGITSDDEIKKVFIYVIHMFGYLQKALGGKEEEGMGKLFNDLVDQLIRTLPSHGSDNVQQALHDALLETLHDNVTSVEDLDLGTGKKLFYVLFGG